MTTLLSIKCSTCKHVESLLFPFSSPHSFFRWLLERVFIPWPLPENIRLFSCCRMTESIFTVHQKGIFILGVCVTPCVNGAMTICLISVWRLNCFRGPIPPMEDWHPTKSRFTSSPFLSVDDRGSEVVWNYT